LCRRGSGLVDWAVAVKFRLIVVGKSPAGPLGAAIAEFEARAGRYWPLEVLEVRAESSRSRPRSEVRTLESQRVMDRVSGMLVVLDERGRSFTTSAFATWMQERRELAEDVSFVVGGPDGIDSLTRQRAAMLLAVAPWTLPHDVARLVLAEQIYRAGTLVRGEPYHRV
jgi:23S rRNA (pseudouridine1915-N3)-methyltransferase